jgi:hypothetical protein
MARKYATPNELREHIDKTSTADDDVLEAILEAASRNIDRACNRPDGFIANVAASARYYVGSGTSIQRIDECVAVSTVAVKDSPSDDEDSYTSWTVGTVGTTTSADCFPATGDPEMPDYITMPHTFLVVGANGDYSVFTSGSFTSRGGFRPTTTVARGLPTVKVTARWGYATTPPVDIKLACLMQSARWYKEEQSAMTDTLASSELGTLLYQKSLHPAIYRILVDGRYVKPAIGRR